MLPPPSLRIVLVGNTPFLRMFEPEGSTGRGDFDTYERSDALESAIGLSLCLRSDSKVS